MPLKKGRTPPLRAGGVPQWSRSVVLVSRAHQQASSSNVATMLRALAYHMAY
jgi:hypothetical protein